MTPLARALFFATVFLAGHFALAANEPLKRHLWVTLDIDGERFDTVVSQPETIDYLLRFVKGEVAQRPVVAEVTTESASVRAIRPDSIHFVERHETQCSDTVSALKQGRSTGCFDSARVVKVKDCGLSSIDHLDACVTLRGVYAGRTPY